MLATDLYFIKKMHPFLSLSWFYFFKKKKRFFKKSYVFILSSTFLCFVFSFKLEGSGFTILILFAYKVTNKLLAFNYVRVKTLHAGLVATTSSKLQFF